LYGTVGITLERWYKRKVPPVRTGLSKRLGHNPRVAEECAQFKEKRTARKLREKTASV
jgi:hypothetical protein